jgi:hypothetical protein
MFSDINWMAALAGGILTGLGATLLLWLNGRIAGVSGVLNGAINPAAPDKGWRWMFLLGVVGGGLIYELGFASTPTPVYALLPVAMILGGFLVGYGARMGNGCTSGHGVCGLGRLSPRSFAAVATFMTAAIATVYVIRHLLPGLL